MSTIENEIWFTKILSLGSSHVFQCKNTNIEMYFEIDEMKIREYYETMFPKWIDGEKYHLISRRLWGLGKHLCLYVDEHGQEFVIESTL